VATTFAVVANQRGQAPWGLVPRNAVPGSTQAETESWWFVKGFVEVTLVIAVVAGNTVSSGRSLSGLRVRPRVAVPTTAS
jgi:hypothetical protein